MISWGSVALLFFTQFASKRLQFNNNGDFAKNLLYFKTEWYCRGVSGREGFRPGQHHFGDGKMSFSRAANHFLERSFLTNIMHIN